MIKYIEQLLQGQPVAWKPLGEVFNTRNGYTPSKQKREYWEGGTIPWYRMEDLRESGRILKGAIQCVTEEGVKRSGLFKKGSIILATTATIGEHALLDCDALANQRFTNFEVKEAYKEALLPKFVFYYFDIVDEWCKRTLTNVGSFPSVDLVRLLNQPFPIPPLSVQAEIVRILDSFTSLTAELEAELEARRTQYAHYRDELLDFSRAGRGEVVYRPLGEVAAFYNGLTGKTRSDFQQGDASYVPYKTVFRGNAVDLSQVESVSVSSGERQNKLAYGDVLFTSSSESLEEVGLSSVVMEEPAQPTYLNSFCFGVRILPEIGIQPGYAKYMFRSEGLRRQIKKTASGVTRINISKALFKKIVIPIPPLEEQERIARLLDEFDTLTSSLTEGLPREIELRRQQYAYYRDQLLSFPRG